MRIATKFTLNTLVVLALMLLNTAGKSLHITLDSIGDGVISTDTPGNINSMNPVDESFTGWTFEDARGKPLAEVFTIVSSQTNEAAVDPVKQVLENGPIVRLANDTILLNKGGTQGQIVRSFEKEGRPGVRVTVEDHGGGIPDKIRDRLFDPFFTTKGWADGTGLGLSISHGIVNDHHGELSFESRQGYYTRFQVDLAVNNGWPTGEAHGKQKAEADYDVVLIDVILPRITGIALLKAIKETSPLVQVVLMTGEPTDETASESLREGALDYLAKPIGKDQIFKTVAKAARIKALDDEGRCLAEENRRQKENLEHLLDERNAALREREQRYRMVLESIGRLADGGSDDLKKLLASILANAEVLLEDMGPEETRRESVDEILRAGFRVRDLLRPRPALRGKQTLDPE